MAKTLTRRITPIPAALRRPGDPAHVQARPWTILQGTGSTHLASHTMHVPTDDSEEARGTRAHEMLHAALSPLPDGPMDLLTLAVEDGRIETLATDAGVERPPSMTRERVNDTLERTALLGNYLLSLAGIAAAGSPIEDWVREWLSSHGHGDISDLMTWAKAQFRRDHGDGSKSRSAVASRLRALRGTGTTGGTLPPAHSYTPPPQAANEPEEQEQEQEQEDSGPDLVLPVDLSEFDLNPGKGDAEDDYDTDYELAHRWATPTLEVPRRPRMVTVKTRGRASDYGTVPAKMHRLAVDGKVFGSRRHVRKGTVLIDASASMDLSADDIERLVRAAPASTVAMYFSDGNGDTGTIRIIAANGEMVSHYDMEPDGQGNGVDGPALHWLSKQRTPRVWVFDGLATGVYDKNIDGAMRKQLDTLERRARVMRVNPDDDGDWAGTVAKALR